MTTNIKDPLNNDEFRELFPHLPIAELLLVEIQSKTDKKWIKILEVFDSRLKIYSCNLCSVRVAGPKGLKSHLEGKKHRTNLGVAGQLYHPSFTYKKPETKLAMAKKVAIKKPPNAGGATTNATQQKAIATVNEKQQKPVTPGIANPQKGNTAAATVVGTNVSQQKTATVTAQKAGVPKESMTTTQKPANVVKIGPKNVAKQPAKVNTGAATKAVTVPNKIVQKPPTAAKPAGATIKTSAPSGVKVEPAANQTKSIKAIADSKVENPKEKPEVSSVDDKQNSADSEIRVDNSEKCLEKIKASKSTKVDSTQKLPNSAAQLGKTIPRIILRKLPDTPHKVEATVKTQNEKGPENSATILKPNGVVKPAVQKQVVQKPAAPISKAPIANESNASIELSSQIPATKTTAEPAATIQTKTPLLRIASNLFVKNPYSKPTKISKEVDNNFSEKASEPTSNEIQEDEAEDVEEIVDLDGDTSHEREEAMEVDNCSYDASANMEKEGEIKPNDIFYNNEQFEAEQSQNSTAFGNDDDDDVIIIEDEHPRVITHNEITAKGKAIPITLSSVGKSQRINVKRNLTNANVQSSLVVPCIGGSKDGIYPPGVDNEEDVRISTNEPPTKYRKVINPAAAFVNAQKALAKENADAGNENDDNDNTAKPRYQTNRILTPSSGLLYKNKPMSKNDEPKFSTKKFSLQLNEEIQGLIGVEYVAKILKTSNDLQPRYECCLCEVRLDGVGMQCHLMGYNHRLKYCEKHFPTCMQQYRQHMTNVNQADVFRVLEPILGKLAKAIESHHGRDLPYECLESEFNKNRMDIMSKIYSFRHACEYQGPSFINVVELKEIYNLIEKKNLYRPPNVSKVLTFDRKVSHLGGPNKRLNIRAGPMPNTIIGPHIPYNTTPVLDNDTHKKMVDEFLRANRSKSPGLNRHHHHHRDGRHRSHDRRRSRSRSQRRSGGHRSRRSRSTSRSGRSRRFYASDRRSISPLRDGDIWQAYRHMFDQSKNTLKETYRNYRKDPETHPMYEEEWQKFWKTRKEQLMAEGKDHRTYDYQPEWVRYFKDRIEEIFDQEVENLKIQARHRLILPMTNDMLEDPSYHVHPELVSDSSCNMMNVDMNQTEAPIGEALQMNERPLMSEMIERPHIGDRPYLGERTYMGARSQMGERPQMGERSQMGERPQMGERTYMGERSHMIERPQISEQSQTIERPERVGRKLLKDRPHMVEHTHVEEMPPLNAHSQNVRKNSRGPAMTQAMVNNQRNPSPDLGSAYKVIPVLRLMTALEEHLGSLGPKVVDLLSKALALEKTHPSQVEEMILTSESCSLLETSMEKLKGVLYAGLLEGSKVKAFKKVISDTEDLLVYASEEGLRDQQPPPPSQPPSLPMPSSVNNRKNTTEIDFQQSQTTINYKHTARTQATTTSTTTSSLSSSSSLLSDVDKRDLASKLAAVLTAQGKTNFDQNQLQQLISVYSRIEKKKRETTGNGNNNNNNGNSNNNANNNSNSQKALSDTLSDLIHGTSSSSHNSNANPRNASSANHQSYMNSFSGIGDRRQSSMSSMTHANRINYPIPADTINPSSSFSNASVHNYVSMLGRNNNGPGTDIGDLWENLQNISRDMNSNPNMKSGGNITNNLHSDMNRANYFDSNMQSNSSGMMTSNPNNYNRNDDWMNRRTGGSYNNNYGRGGGGSYGGGDLSGGNFGLSGSGRGTAAAVGSYGNSFGGNINRGPMYATGDGDMRPLLGNDMTSSGIGGPSGSSFAGGGSMGRGHFNRNSGNSNFNSTNIGNSGNGNQLWPPNQLMQMDRGNNPGGRMGGGVAGGGGGAAGGHHQSHNTNNQRSFGRGNPNNWRTN